MVLGPRLIPTMQISQKMNSGIGVASMDVEFYEIKAEPAPTSKEVVPLDSRSGTSSDALVPLIDES